MTWPSIPEIERNLRSGQARETEERLAAERAAAQEQQEQQEQQPNPES